MDGTQHRKSYFLIAVSTRENLNRCLESSLAGFPSNISGAWAWCDIRVGDFVSFLYGARVYNLYRVHSKFCLEDDENQPPYWKPLEFGSGRRRRRYTFPFRLELEPVRIFAEPLVRVEFSYVSENLLLRGGYRKSHFQADTIDLGNASRLGKIADIRPNWPSYSSQRFNLKFAFDKSLEDVPKVFTVDEKILQAAIRHRLSEVRNLEEFLEKLSIKLEASQLEVLGEKALPRGYVDMLIKETIPAGLSRKIIVEVKKERALERDFRKVLQYRGEVGRECVAAVIIARKTSNSLRRRFKQVSFVRYSIKDVLQRKFTFEELVNALEFEYV